MTGPVLSPFMRVANDYINNGKIDLAAVVTSFRLLGSEDQRLEFGRLCLRKNQVADRLINLLFAVGALLPCPRQTTFNFLERSWQKRGIDAGLAEQMLIMLNELFAP